MLTRPLRGLDGERQEVPDAVPVGGFRRISGHAGVAVIASEDQLFAVHTGFDLKSIRKARGRNGRGKRLRGASTITQQVAKNLFLWSGRSYVRKGIEAWFTMLIELVWPKQRILEVYLNIAQFGRGVYGVEAASRVFYHALRLTYQPRASRHARRRAAQPAAHARGSPVALRDVPPRRNSRPDARAWRPRISQTIENSSPKSLAQNLPAGI